MRFLSTYILRIELITKLSSSRIKSNNQGKLNTYFIARAERHNLILTANHFRSHEVWFVLAHKTSYILSFENWRHDYLSYVAMRIGRWEYPSQRYVMDAFVAVSCWGYGLCFDYFMISWWRICILWWYVLMAVMGFIQSKILRGGGNMKRGSFWGTIKIEQI